MRFNLECEKPPRIPALAAIASLMAASAGCNSELDACESRLRDAISEVHRIVDGDRVATVRIDSYFSGGIETEEQLDASPSAGTFALLSPSSACGSKVPSDSS